MRIPYVSIYLLAAVSMAAQPLQIQPSTMDLIATGVHLVPLDDIGHLATVKSILGGDPAPMLAALLPAGGVLVVNGSPKTLIAVGVAWRGPSKDQAGRTAKLIITEVLPVAPGASMIFTPGSPINHYLHGSVQIINGSKSGAPPSKAPDFASFVQESLSSSPIAQYVESYLAGVAFDDNTFVGADMVLGPLQRSHPEIHR